MDKSMDKSMNIFTFFIIIGMGLSAIAHEYASYLQKTGQSVDWYTF